MTCHLRSWVQISNFDEQNGSVLNIRKRRTDTVVLRCFFGIVWNHSLEANTYSVCFMMSHLCFALIEFLH
mgnify:CR=1 FL=1